MVSDRAVAWCQCCTTHSSADLRIAARDSHWRCRTPLLLLGTVLSVGRPCSSVIHTYCLQKLSIGGKQCFLLACEFICTAHTTIRFLPFATTCICLFKCMWSISVVSCSGFTTAGEFVHSCRYPPCECPSQPVGFSRTWLYVCACGISGGYVVYMCTCICNNSSSMYVQSNSVSKYLG